MPTTQANIEYWYRLAYNCLSGGCFHSVDLTQASTLLSHLWLWIVVIGYALSVAGLIAIVYLTVRIFELREREDAFYGTLITTTGEEARNQRWEHIQLLASSDNPSDKRQAILEADIMLDEMLTKQGYTGASVGEKLKEVEPSDFNTLQDAWEAHKIRNQIAHEGSAFDLSDVLMQRTLARYEAVFREFEIL